jgi:site-specific DNA-adenine methylase
MTERRHISHDLAAHTAWGLMKSIMWEGNEYESIDELHPLISSILGDYRSAKDNDKPTKGILPDFDFDSFGDGGKRRGKPWANMARIKQQGGDPTAYLASLPGFTNPQSEMLPTVVNWIGGKTQIAPQLRAIASRAGDKIPAELFGGSGSFILGMNQGRGLFADINPDMTNLMTQLQQGMGDVNIAQDHDDQVRMIDELNQIRYRRDVMGQRLDDDDLMRMAHLLVGTNLQHRDGMFGYKPWDETPAVPYTEGSIKTPSKGAFRRTKQSVGHANHRYFPKDIGTINLDPFANRLKDVDIHTGDLRQTSQYLTPEHLLYLDPPYVDRLIDYGGSSQQMEGKGLDQLQRDTLRIGAEHEGPSIYSNYLYGKDGMPLYDLIDEAVDSGYSLYPWLRKPKGNKDAKVEMLGLKGFPKMSSQQQKLF